LISLYNAINIAETKATPKINAFSTVFISISNEQAFDIAMDMLAMGFAFLVTPLLHEGMIQTNLS
jgi:hypothetical protein